LKTRDPAGSDGVFAFSLLAPPALPTEEKDEMTTPRQPIEGLWLPLVTPLRDGALDEASLARLLRHYLDQPVDGLILAATTGEGMTLDGAETERLCKVAAAEVRGRLPLFLGLAGADTRALVARTEGTSRWPVDGYLVSSPCYVRPSQEGLHRHFTSLAEATDRPIILYNIPYRTGVTIANDTILRLAEVPNIVGLKDCGTDAEQSAELLRARPDGFAVLTGEDARVHDALVRGADGAILASAHVETGRFARVRAAMAAGDNETAHGLWRDLVDLTCLLFAEPSPAPVKHMLWRQGLIASAEVRLPMTPVSDGLADRLDAEVARLRRTCSCHRHPDEDRDPAWPGAAYAAPGPRLSPG
jgi:4-hydroxy-tetrahydrodipicolinate synthase